jgi:hypothetical protein
MDIAEQGYMDFVKDPKKRLAGLMNLTIWGVSVTSVLQTLRHIEPDFDQWYKKYSAEMLSDPLMRYFWILRSEILKEGKLNVSTFIHIKHLTSLDFDRIPKPPSNVKVKEFFMGDNLGGSGYVIQQPDGSDEKYYVEIPSDIMTVSLHFPDPPEMHLEKKLLEHSVESLSRLYLDYLQRMVKDAKARFEQKTNSEVTK